MSSSRAFNPVSVSTISNIPSSTPSSSSSSANNTPRHSSSSSSISSLTLEPDELGTNPFFTLFLSSQYASILNECTSNGWMFVCPLKESLRLITLNSDFLYTHILKPHDGSLSPAAPTAVSPNGNENGNIGDGMDVPISPSPNFGDSTVSSNGSRKPSHPQSSSSASPPGSSADQYPPSPTSSSSLFLTHNNKEVILRDRKLICHRGFPRARTVTVIGEETYYDENFNSISVLRVNFPLEGKIPLQFYKLITSHANGSIIALERRTLMEHEQFLSKLLNNENIHKHDNLLRIAIDKFVEQFNSDVDNDENSSNDNSELMEAFQPNSSSLSQLADKLRVAVVRIRDETITRANISTKQITASRGLLKDEIACAIESELLAGLHKKLFVCLVDYYSKDEELTQMRLGAMQAIPMSEYGVREDILCEPNTAIRQLGLLNAAITPLQKLVILADATRMMTEAVDDAKGKKLTGGNHHRGDSVSSPKTNFIENGRNASRSRGDSVVDDIHDNGLASATVSPLGSPAALDSRKRRDTSALSADDILPLTVYALVQSGLSHLHANLCYLNYFLPLSQSSGIGLANQLKEPPPYQLNISHLFVHLANFQAALAVIDSGKMIVDPNVLKEIQKQMQIQQQMKIYEQQQHHAQLHAMQKRPESPSSPQRKIGNNTNQNISSRASNATASSGKLPQSSSAGSLLPPMSKDQLRHSSADRDASHSAHSSPGLGIHSHNHNHNHSQSASGQSGRAPVNMGKSTRIDERMMGSGQQQPTPQGLPAWLFATSSTNTSSSSSSSASSAAAASRVVGVRGGPTPRVIQMEDGSEAGAGRVTDPANEKLGGFLAALKATSGNVSGNLRSYTS